MKRDERSKGAARRRAHTAIRGLAVALTLFAGTQLGGSEWARGSNVWGSVAEAAWADSGASGGSAHALQGASFATSANGLYDDSSQQSSRPNAGRKAREIHVPASAGHLAYWLYVPAGIARPQVAVLALHGMGGSGQEMLAAVRANADALGWAVVAPTVSYGDWLDPDKLLREELWLQPQLIRLTDEAFRSAGIAAPRSVVVFGFSRGAQAAGRLALLYPERISAVALLSAGAYTLPVGSVSFGGAMLAAPLPFGTADFEERIGRAPNVAALGRVRFWVGVGARDTSAGDVPRQWDPFEGTQRVERARRFAAAEAQLGGEVQLTLLPNTTHELTAAAMGQAFHFLAGGSAVSPSA